MKNSMSGGKCSEDRVRQGGDRSAEDWGGQVSVLPRLFRERLRI